MQRRHLYPGLPNHPGTHGNCLVSFLGVGMGGQMKQDPEEEIKRPLATATDPQLFGHQWPTLLLSNTISVLLCACSELALVLCVVQPHPSGKGSQLIREGCWGDRLVLVTGRVECGGWKETPLWMLGAESRGQPWPSRPITQSHFVLKGFDGRPWTASLGSFTH